MEKLDLDQDWSLRIHNPITLKLGDSIPIDLPHDYSIFQEMDPLTFATASNAYLPGGIIEYEKKLFAPEQWSGKKVILEFEGIYMNSVVRLNGNIVGRNPYGYTSFHCDLTSGLKIGAENVITVRVNNSALPNTRWYSGTGIYRHTWLLIGGSAYIKPWGIFVKTPIAKESKAVFDITTQVVSNMPQNNEQKLTVKQILTDNFGNTVGGDEKSFAICGLNSEFEASQQITVDNPKLWSPDSPCLYELTTQIIKDGEVIDCVKTKTGAREISFSAKEGFKLNGNSMKLKGGCVHHDCGLLGAAAYDRAEWRKVELLIDSGFNAVRTAHNPPSPAFLDACDFLGMLVIDEAFDCWNERKMENDYNVFFADWWEKDMLSMVLRDRNHPSIIMWSTGNEIPERDGRSDGYALSEKLCSFVRELDNTRAVTNALCAIYEKQSNREDWPKITAQFSEPLDVVGYNYLLDRYENDGVLFPDRIICGTETFPKDAFDYWQAVEKLPYVIGDFVWTSLDYLGEAGIGRVLAKGETTFVGAYPWSHANCGDIDICGFKRPQSFYRDCVWGISKQPYIAVRHPKYSDDEPNLTPWGFDDVYPVWTWPGYEGSGVKISVYSMDDEVELILSGKSLGRKRAGKAEKYIAAFDATYEPGELTAISYIGGKEKTRTTLKTAGEPESLLLIPDRDTLQGFGDLSYITVYAVDRDGNYAVSADNSVFITARGEGSLIAVGSSNPITNEGYTGNTKSLYYGRAMAVVCANGKPGDITLSVSAEGLQSAQIVIKVR